MTHAERGSLGGKVSAEVRRKRRAYEQAQARRRLTIAKRKDRELNELLHKVAELRQIELRQMQRAMEDRSWTLNKPLDGAA